jgi:mannose-6-phosphate isomerase-like protein (cupin superfamily)
MAGGARSARGQISIFQYDLKNRDLTPGARGAARPLRRPGPGGLWRLLVGGRKNPTCIEDAADAARRNTWFRQAACTNRYSQLVLMAVPPGEEIGDEIHESTDQVFVVVEGRGEALVAGRPRSVGAEDVIIVPAGARHNIRNTGHVDLKLFTIYAPPAFAEGTIHRTREDAVGAMITRGPAWLS